jgi:uncharacterized membrane protein YhaH (DUF805 family)
MRKARNRHQVTIALDIMFLSLFLATIALSSAVFLDTVFVIPALLSFLTWLSLSLMILRKKGVSMKSSFLERRLISGLPSNKKLHDIYVGALLISLMIFFALMLVGKELYLLLAFLVWLFIGSLATQELDRGPEREESRKSRKTAKQNRVSSERI